MPRQVEQGIDLGDAHALGAGDARLTDLQQRFPDTVAITNTHFAVRQAVDREIFPELAIGEFRPAEFVLPIARRLELINQHRALLATVTCKVRLSVAVMLGYSAPPGSRLFHPWKREKSPAFHASRNLGALRSQSGRISLVTARRSRQRSAIDGRPQNQ